MFCMLKKYSQHNSNREKQSIILIIANGKGWR